MGVRLHRWDAEFFPLRSRRDSSASRRPTKTHGEETRPSSATIRGHISDNIFNTVRTRSSKNSAEASKSQLFRQDYNADLGGGSISFTLQRATSRENIHSDVVKERVTETNTKAQDTLFLIFVQTNELLQFFFLRCTTHYSSITFTLKRY